MNVPLVAVVVAVPLNSERFGWSQYRCVEHEMDHAGPPRIVPRRSHNPSVVGTGVDGAPAAVQQQYSSSTAAVSLFNDP